MLADKLIFDVLIGAVAIFFEGEEGQVAEEVVLALRELEVLVDLLHSCVWHLLAFMQDLGDSLDDVQTCWVELFLLELLKPVFRHKPQRCVHLCLLLKDLKSKPLLTLFLSLLLLHYLLHSFLQNTTILYHPICYLILQQ